MIIYGVALLSGCLVIGNLIGEALGALLGIKANVGGVGIAMLFLVVVTNSRLYQNQHADAASSGIQFWSAMYIPIVVAMAAQQNVVSAMKGGILAVVAGVAAVVLSFMLVPLLSRIGSSWNR
ncbi:MAG: hypothetical protein RI897_3002 [Verrucomicrobiota bacterium]|jgi:malonate transporter MadL subunit